MNDILESKIGGWLVIAYTLAAIGAGIYSFACASASCAPFLVMPIMPWAWLMQSMLGFEVPLMSYPVLILLNAMVIYIAGVAIEWLWYRARKQR